MPREQEPARIPLRPSQANTQTPADKQEKQVIEISSSPVATYPKMSSEDVSSPQPLFGKTTALGMSPQPFARPPPTQKPANIGVQRQGGNRLDPHAGLFIASSNRLHRPDLHKPSAASNPLSQLHRSAPTSTNPLRPLGTAQPGSRRINIDDDDDVFIIPKPTNIPHWQPKPISYPTFSSQQPTATFYKPKQDQPDSAVFNTGSLANGGIWSERYNSSDPYEFMDSAKANEQLKALFEGSVEDEDDKPKIRRQNKKDDAKIDDLASQIQNLNVKADQKDSTAKVDKEQKEEHVEEEDDDGTVEGLKVKLLPHQIEGVAWLRSRELGNKSGKGKTMGGILADDMGLGKTIQSIALILTNPKPVVTKADSDDQKKHNGSTLVVAPLALIKQWEAEIKDRIEKSHALKVCVHHGPKRTKSFKELSKYDVVITTYSTLTSEHALCTDNLPAGCFGLRWFRVILDEAHSIKNRNAKATKAACALDAKYRWCLSGTPMQNNLDELQSLIHFLRISPLDKLDYWRDFITRPMNSGRGGLAIKRLQAVLRNIMKRRTKDVLKQSGALNTGKLDANGNKPTEFKIVKRTVENVEAEFAEHERSFYERLESRTDKRLEMMMAGNQMSYASALVLLMRLRQACNHPKLIGGDLAADKDALADNASQTPRKKASQVVDDTDDLAAMLGGLSVGTKLCDVCQIELSKAQVQHGSIRCDECEDDLSMVSKQKDRSKKEDKVAQIKNDRNIKRNVIIDSDDDDEADTSAATIETTLDDDNEDGQYSNDSDDYEESPPSDLITSTKIRRLLSILRADSHRHKYIVFSVFTSMLNLIEPFLRQSRIKFVRYDGSMRNDHREASLHSLKTDPTVRVLLCSLRAGSLGLNLTAASRVVVLEPFWNPFVEEQAIDRVHRLNQTQDVVVYKMTIKDTVEARILELQEKKRALAQATVESGGVKGSAVAKLSMADMLKLFDHRAERDAKVDMVGMKDTRGLLGEAGAERTDRDGDQHQDKDDDESIITSHRNRGHLTGNIGSQSNTSVTAKFDNKGISRRDESDRDRHRERKDERRDRPKAPDVYSRRW